jgi:hypothetical protein
MLGDPVRGRGAQVAEDHDRHVVIGVVGELGDEPVDAAAMADPAVTRELPDAESVGVAGGAAVIELGRRRHLLERGIAHHPAAEEGVTPRQQVGHGGADRARRARRVHADRIVIDELPVPVLVALRPVRMIGDSSQYDVLWRPASGAIFSLMYCRYGVPVTLPMITPSR